MKFVKLLPLGFGIVILTIMKCAPKTTAVSTQNKMTQSQEVPSQNQLFISGFSGGAQDRSYKIITNEKEFDEVLRKVQASDKLSAKSQFPAGQIVILYNMGEYRSGDHRVKGIDSVRVENDVLKVFTKRNNQNSEMAIQALSTPWFIFSVSKDLKFNQIEVK